MATRDIEVRAQWDPEAGLWWATAEALPLTTEAASFDALMARVAEIAPEIAEMNGLAAPGDNLILRVVTERSVLVPRAA